MRFHHVGVAVKSIADSAGWWTDVMGFTTESEIIHDPLQKVRVQFFVKPDGFRVELVEAAADDSPVLRYVGSENGGSRGQRPARGGCLSGDPPYPCCSVRREEDRIPAIR